MDLLKLPEGPSLLLTDYETSEDERDELELNDDILRNSKHEDISLSKQIMLFVLEDWMYGYKTLYTINQYQPLFVRILELVSEEKILDFLRPGFPVKSPNTVSKVLGSRADFAEFLALRSFVITIRKIENIYEHGVRVTIMSDYHTFDRYLGITEEIYDIYHNDLKEMISLMGAENIIRIISLGSFPEFQNTISADISTKLKDDYGSPEFLEKFDEKVRSDPNLLERYKQMLKFMQRDQETKLPGSPRSKQTRKFLKEITTGMMSQGLALDAFLKEQHFLLDYVRISIHQHHPKSEKFAVDLFKQFTVNKGILRTPWHHSVLYHTMKDEFIIDHKDHFMKNQEDKSFDSIVMCNDKTWFLMRIFRASHAAVLNENDMKIAMLKVSCGIVIENTSSNPELDVAVFHPDCITSMIKTFGVVVLRGFKRFHSEKDLFNSYNKHGPNGIIPWSFGSVHKVKPNKNMPGFVTENGQLPVHWDMVLPPQYMKIDQSKHKYEDFTCQQFLLYCHTNSTRGTPGGTTFVDAHSAVLSLHGKLADKWKNTHLIYENRLKNSTGDNLYFGGKGNHLEYPIIMKCPWTKKDILRWCEHWDDIDHPETSQIQIYSIKSQAEEEMDVKELESKIKSIALDERYFFSHSYAEGDQVYVNNYTMLHGRQAFTNTRELWRVQLIPPSKDIPEYYKTNGKQFSSNQ